MNEFTTISPLFQILAQLIIGGNMYQNSAFFRPDLSWSSYDNNHQALVVVPVLDLTFSSFLPEILSLDRETEILSASDGSLVQAFHKSPGTSLEESVRQTIEEAGATEEACVLRAQEGYPSTHTENITVDTKHPLVSKEGGYVYNNQELTTPGCDQKEDNLEQISCVIEQQEIVEQKIQALCSPYAQRLSYGEESYFFMDPATPSRFYYVHTPIKDGDPHPFMDPNFHTIPRP